MSDTSITVIYHGMSLTVLYITIKFKSREIRLIVTQGKVFCG